MRPSLLLLCLSLAACGPGSGSSEVAAAPSPIEVIKVDVGGTTIQMTRRLDVMTVEFQATAAQVWSALSTAHLELGIPVVKADRATGTASYIHRNKGMLDGKRVSTYVDCGSTVTGARADMYAVTITENEALSAPRAGTTALSIGLNTWAKNPNESTASVPCSSTGALEKRIVQLVVENMK